MSRMRVHELAKELNKTSKELMEILEKNQIEVKSHQSVLEEEQVQKVKALLAPKRKKRKNIIQVFNPQNSRMSGGPDERLRRERKPRPARDAQGNPVRRPRPEGAPAVKRPAAERAAAGTAEQKRAAADTAEQRRAAAGEQPVAKAPAAEAKPAEKAAVTETNADALQAQQAMQGQAEPAVKAQKTVKEQETVKAQETRKAQETAQVQEHPQAAREEKKSRPAREQRPENRGADNRPENRSGRDNRSNQGSRENRDNRSGANGGRENRGEGRSYGGNRDSRGDGRSYSGSRENRGSDSRSGARDGRGDGRSYGANRDSRGEGRSYGGSRGEGRSYSGNRDSRGDGRSYSGSRDNRGSENRGGRDGRSYGGNRDNRGEGRSYGGDNRGGRGDSRGGRGGRLAMPERPTEAIERQTQKNERQNDRNNKRSDKRNDRDRFDKKQNKAGTRNLQKQVNKPVKPQPKPQEPKEETIRTITLPELMTIRELADKMKVQPSVIVKKLFLQGTVVTVNQEIDFEKAEEIALEFNCIAEPEVKVDVIAELLKEDEENEKDMEPRVPVVCVMGHVDHGKTSLLDAIRDTHVTDREAGGITQHIGASVVTCNGQKITFLDTPGHEAFTAMRMRGANSTDIAVLVVAADDGVMPQTVEAISHAKAAGVEIIVAINKIDKPSANVEKVKQELTEYELVPEDWGGSTVFVPVSAHTHEGIDQLLEMILLTAEVMELKANPKRQARGLVIEGKLDKGKGPVANVLVQKGTLHVGDFIAAGACSGRVRAMMDDKGRRVKEAGPSMPVEVLGFNEVPGAGEIFVAPKTDKEAKSFAETFVSEGRERLLEETRHRMSLDDLFSQIQAGNLKELNLIVKADVQGSVEAVKASLQKLSNEEVVVKIIHGGVGAINESDVVLASASNAIIIGFNVRPDAVAKATAEREGVDVRLYKVIYNAIEDVEAAMKGMLDPVFEEKVIGHAEVRQLFKASGVGTIAGSYVLDGVFQRGCSIRIRRGDEQIFDGALASLKRFKDDVKEVKAGYECGLVVEKFNDIQEGDVYEAYTMVEVPR